MIVTIAVASGINHVYMIGFIFGLMWCTMTYGYYTEVLSRPQGRAYEKPMKWDINSTRFDFEFPFLPPWLSATLQRIFPHLMGYVPYSLVWVALLHSFFSNVGDGEGPPAFVYAATETLKELGKNPYFLPACLTYTLLYSPSPSLSLLFLQ